MIVSQVMTKEVVGLLPEENALQALDKLLEMGISGLPVISPEGKLLGMFTEKEVIAKIFPSYLESVGGFQYDQDAKGLKQKIANFSGLAVKDVMRKDVICVEESTALYEAAHLMLTQKARRLPVLNKEKKIIGIISRGDVVKAIFSQYK